MAVPRRETGAVIRVRVPSRPSLQNITTRSGRTWFTTRIEPCNIRPYTAVHGFYFGPLFNAIQEQPEVRRVNGLQPREINDQRKIDQIDKDKYLTATFNVHIQPSRLRFANPHCPPYWHPPPATLYKISLSH